MVAPISCAMTSTIWFSNPSPRSFENGRLFGSAQTRNSRAAAPEAATRHKPAPKSSRHLREDEIIQHPSLGGDVLQVAHGVEEAQRPGAVAWVEVGRDDHARPAADTR